MQSDVFRAPLVAMAIDEGAAFGAALLGGVAGKLWPDVPAACAAAVRVGAHGDAPCRPDRKAAAIYRKYYPIYRGLYRPLKPTFAKLASAVEATQV
jgi:xylulokinase